MTTVSAVDVVVEYKTSRGPVRALDGATFVVAAADVVGVVGESGSGKSTLAASLAGLLPANAEIVSGRIEIAGRAVEEMTPAERIAMRREGLGFVFQDPVATLDPTAKIRRQLRWLLGRRVSDARLEELLAGVGLHDPGRVLDSFPHQLSGGMAQRVSIAMALAQSPALVVADEPTASLDASVRLGIMELLVAQCHDAGATVVLLTHDLRAVRRFCNRVAVMYGGRVVETGEVNSVFAKPAHPYTRAIIDAEPGFEGPDGMLRPIPGRPPVLVGACSGCSFEDRCPNSDHSTCITRRPSGEAHPNQALCHYPLTVLQARAKPSARSEQ